jgi:hypothetical protein
MEHYGFIKEENGVKIPAVPYITIEDEKTLHDIETDLGADFCDACLKDVTKLCRKNKTSYPKRISFAEELAFNSPVNQIVMACVYEALERGIISVEDRKHYPIT